MYLPFESLSQPSRESGRLEVSGTVLTTVGLKSCVVELRALCVGQLVSGVPVSMRSVTGALVFDFAIFPASVRRKLYSDSDY